MVVGLRTLRGHTRSLVLVSALVAHASASAQSPPQWIMRDDDPAFAVQMPTGFIRRSTGDTAYGAYVHPGRRALMVLFDAGPELVQNAGLTAEHRQTLQTVEGMTFDDRAVTFSVQNFTVPAYRGVAQTEAGPMVRWVVALPTRGRLTGLCLLGPLSDQAALEQTFAQTLSIARVKTHWMTFGQRVFKRVTADALRVGLSVGLLYFLIWLARWRRDAASQGSRVRAALRVVLGLSMLVHAGWWLRPPNWEIRVMGVLIALFALRALWDAVSGLRGIQSPTLDPAKPVTLTNSLTSSAPSASGNASDPR
ncbi:MAG: hypothetical protein Q8Q09_28215 [Deltaproteobacteria bacterium]|nr:hypothetical protein [Deltaproteobacteria bacterium]